VRKTQVEFVTSVFSPSEFPRPGIPEIVIAGRSNVGKSSLINRLTGAKSLARTSAKPGKTRSINFYRCNDLFYLVDLPGFGYARGRHQERGWKGLIEQYFERGPAVAMVVHLVDARMPPTRLDIQFADWLEHLQIPCLVTATKSDKLSGNQRSLESRAISQAFPGVPVIFTSAVTGAGCKELWNRVVETTQNR
jgi:GTP-binding protein